MKTCKTCNIEKPFENFYSNGYTPKGSKKYKPNCKACESELKYVRFVNTLTECLKEQGRELKCERCGYDTHKAAIQFHHNKGEKNFEISNAKSRSKESIFKELELCEVLCANCHAVEHCNYSMTYYK